MDNQKLQTYFFVFLLLATTILMGLVFYPFIGVLALAAILSLALQPTYEKIKSLFRVDWLSSLIVIVLLAIFIIIPLILLGWQILKDAQSLYTDAVTNKIVYVDKINTLLEGPLKRLIPDFSINLSLYIQKLFNWFVGNIGPLVSSTTQILFDLLLVIVALFFFLKDNLKIRKLLLEISPLEDKYDNLILEKLDNAVNSVVKGSLLIAVIQGALAGIGFWVFGIPSPVFWGTIGVIVALVPGIGTSLVMLPAIAYLFINGSYLAAFGLFIWGTILVGSIDNVLRTIIYKKGVSAHPIFILFAVFGGLSLFGPLGLLFGPIILSFYLTLLEIYKIISKSPHL
ncbi:MAG: AI-2E family transporter [bacterium]|nr:AI-2E family transporter [bacterium]